MLELTEDGLHSVFILAGLRSRRHKLQALLNLIPERFADFGGRVLGEAVDSAGDRALVRQVARDLALVGSACAANERRVEEESVLGSLALGLESTEKRLLGTEDLDGRRRVL